MRIQASNLTLGQAVARNDQGIGGVITGITYDASGIRVRFAGGTTRTFDRTQFVKLV